MKLNQLAIAALLIAGAAPAASADVLIMEPRARAVTVPAATVVRTTRVAPPTTGVTVRSITRTLPPADRTVTQSVLIAPRQSDFSHRLNMLRDQIQLGQQNGMLDGSSAAALNSEYARLSAAVDAMKMRGFSNGEDAMIEKEINVFNQRVSDSMAR